MFAMTAAERWRPNRRLLGALGALSLFAVLLLSTSAALHGPRWLGYHAAPLAAAHRWRVTAVWPSSFAWDARLRPGTQLCGAAPPATVGQATLRVWTGHTCRPVPVPPRGETMPLFTGVELALAAVVVGLGVGTFLLARVRTPALLLLVYCLAVAAGLCGVAAFSHGAVCGGLLVDVALFALVPPLTLALAATLPPGGRRCALSWRVPAGLSLAMLALQAISFADVRLYTRAHDVEGILFALSQVAAVGLWLWRAAGARGGPAAPEYRAVLLGVGGAGGGFAALAVLPVLLQWRPPWPPEAGGLVLLLCPVGLAWALLRHHLLGLRRPLQRTAITVALLCATTALGLALAADGISAPDMLLVVLVAGVGVPLAQRAADRLFPDSQAPYAALLRASGAALALAVTPADVAHGLEPVRRGLGLGRLVVRQDDQVVAAVGSPNAPLTERLVVRHDDQTLALLEVGEKLHHDALLAADREALTMLSQQIGAFLARQHLVWQLRATVARLEEIQARLLTARRRERERLAQRLHRGPVQEIALVRGLLPQGSEARAAVTRFETALRAILTETASDTLQHLGLPAALRAYAAYLTPFAREHGLALSLDIAEDAGAVAEDAAFALYGLAHEALTNAVRHSGGRHVAVRLAVEGAAVALEVRDDGVGLPTGWAQERLDHRGLRDALDLVQTVPGAVATAAPAVGGGTVVTARLPLQRVQAGSGTKETGMERDGTIRLVIAEDHVVVRQGLRRLLMEDPRLHVVAEAGNGHEILSLVLLHRPDVLLLDLDLPGQSGLDALALVRAHVTPPPRVLVLSAYHDEEFVRRAREQGVAGFLSKGSDGPALRAAIYRVMSGLHAFDPLIASILQEQTYSEGGRFRRYADGSIALTAAELDVLRAMAAGHSYEEIAAAQARSVETVRTHAAKVQEKLDVHTREQAVLKALRLGILRLDES